MISVILDINLFNFLGSAECSPSDIPQDISENGSLAQYAQIEEVAAAVIYSVEFMVSWV